MTDELIRVEFGGQIAHGGPSDPPVNAVSVLPSGRASFKDA